MTTLLSTNRSHGTWGPFGSKNDDRYTISMPPGEIFDSCMLTVTGKRGSAGVRLEQEPGEGQTGTAEIVVHWWHEGGSEIKYHLEALSRKPAAQSGTRVMVPGFLPSTSGFHFSNSFAKRPVIILKTPVGNIDLGNAALGLCGGMTFALRDYFEARHPIPPGTDAPEGGPLFDYIVHRLFDSFNLPTGVMKYLDLMNPALPDHETDASRIGILPHGRTWRMCVEEWPRIKADLDSGHLCPLALVYVKSADPAQLGNNHQVIAYGYNLSKGSLTLMIYDPNHADDDNITLKLDLNNPEHTQQIECPTGKPVYSFFRPNYNFEAPPGFAGGIKTRAAFRSMANQKLVCAENAGSKPLITNRDNIGPWETFEIIVVGSNRIALKSMANNKYVCADNAGQTPLIANRDQIGPWETFELEYMPGNNIALISMANRKYVCAENCGSLSLIANRDRAASWETFTILPA